MSTTKLHSITNHPLTSRPQTITTHHHNKMLSAKNPLLTTRIDFKSTRNDKHLSPATTMFKQWSKHHLLTLKKSIEDCCSTTTKVRQQLNLQKQTSHQLLSRIKSSMIETQLSGIDLITRYEEEKCKHEYLGKLVNHYRTFIQSQKQKHVENQKEKKILSNNNNVELNQYQQLCIELKQKQKLLQNITGKLNSFQCQKTSKYQIVKAQRRQRTVFSNQFNKFQNQIFILSQKYKQSLIQRILLQKQFQQQKQQFLKVQNQWKKHTNIINSKDNNNSNKSTPNHKLGASQDYSWQLHQQQQQTTLKQQLMIEPSLIRSRSRFNYIKMEKIQFGEKNHLSYEMNQKKIVNLEFKKKLQQVMNDLGVNSVRQLRATTSQSMSYDIGNQQLQQKQTNTLDEPLSAVEIINHQKRQQLHKLQNAISEWQIKINELKNVIKTTCHPPKQAKSDKLKLKQINQTKLIASQLSQNLLQINKQINEFNGSQNLLNLIKLLNLSTANSQTEENAQKASSSESKSLQIDLNTISQIQQKLFLLSEKLNLSDLKPKPRNLNIRKSFIFQSLFTHPRQKQSLVPSQSTICPILESIKPQTKRTKTTSSPLSEFQPTKKLTSLLRNQSRIKGVTDISSKDQMIRQAIEAFGKEGIIRPEKFQVRYS